MKQGEHICHLSWSVNCGFVHNGNLSERGRAWTPTPSPARADFSIMMECGVQRGSDTSASACCTYGKPEFESRLGTPEEALYRAEAMRIPREYIFINIVLYVCSINVKINQKSGSVPPNLINRLLPLCAVYSVEKTTSAHSLLLLCTELKFLNILQGLGTEQEQGYRTGPPGFIGWRNSFLGIDSWAP